MPALSVILNNLTVRTSGGSSDLSCTDLLLEIRKPGDEHGHGNISIQSDCGIHQSVKTLRRACSDAIYIYVARVTRSARSAKSRTDVASYCALPAESRSTSLSDWVTECHASFIGVHFRPEKPILLRDTRWMIRLHTLSYRLIAHCYTIICRHFVTCWFFNNKRVRPLMDIYAVYTPLNYALQ